MCGLNGIYAYNVSANFPKHAELIATRDHMTARGPDGCGEYWSEDRRLGLGHRRLSIVDLSERGAQPMASADGRYHVTFNGEIYNYPGLRRELEAQGTHFESDSDTEVLLHLYAREGERMVHRLRGMFAFAIWDNAARSVFLARDPYGIKPLYVADDGWTFRFASQVKALLAGGNISRDPEPAGITGFHLWGSVPEPFTLYRDIRALPAGHTQLIDAAGPYPAKSYCSLAQIFANGAAAGHESSDIGQTVRQAALDSVAAHLLADVEVGVFLSAGVDSGAILGLMRDAGQAKVRGITLAFDEFRGTADDEAAGAAAVAQHYGAEHVVRWVGEDEFRSDIPAILTAMDQPSIDGINSWFISKAAREAGLKVALSGVGGDELFGGYPSFRDIPRWVAMLRAPAAVPGLGPAFRKLASLGGMTRNNPKLAGMLEYGGSWSGAYLLRRALLLPFELRDVIDDELVRTGMARLQPLRQLDALSRPNPHAAASRVAAFESGHYLRNQLLRDVDWAGMAHSIEVRSPLVDIELLRKVSPVTAIIKGRRGKLALANAPSKPLPREFFDKPKSGFSVPTSRWIASAKSGALVSNGLASRAWAKEVSARWNP